MPSLNFPTPTTVGEQYLDWVWNGVGWDSLQTLPGGLPAGAIIQWGGTTAPVNWLLCDGSAVSRTTYASLFAAVGTSYGVGDGSTTFNLPDLRGRVPVGKNGGSFGTLGATGGAETVTLTANNLPAHNHPITDPGHNHSQDSHYHGTNNYNGGGNTQGRPTTNASAHGDVNYWNFYGSVGYSSVAQPYIYPNTTGITVGNNSTTNSAVNNLQPYQVVNYIIKATAAITPGESELAPRVGALEAVNSGSRLTSVEARATALELADSTTNKSGLVPIIPTSVSVGSGSATVNSNGTIFFTNAEYMQLNGVFTTAFDFYKLVYTHNGKSSNSSLRWTTNGTPNATSGQYYSSIYVFRSNGTSACYGNSGGASITDLSFGSDANASTLSADISGPANSSFRTQMQWQQNGAGMEGRVGAAEYSNPATVFDGFRVYPLNGAGTYTATMNVYGYRR